MRKIKMPDWTKELPDDTYLSTIDVMGIFQYKNPKNITDLISKGYIPEPDKKQKRMRQTRPKLLWSLKLIRSVANGN